MALYRDHLACAIARHHFKPIVGEVVRILLTNPGIPFSRLFQYSSPFFERTFHASKKPKSHAVLLSDSERRALIRDALVVLLQHCIAYVVDHPVNGHIQSLNPPKLLYYIDATTLLFRPRIPLYLASVKQTHGALAVCVLKALFQHGRLTSRQLFTATILPALPRLRATTADAESCLLHMAESGVLRWHSRTSFSPLASVIQQRERPGAANIDEPGVGGKRIRPLDLAAEECDPEGEFQPRPPDGADCVMVGKGRHARFVGAPRCDNHVDVWTVGYWHLNRHFRNQCCVLALRGSNIHHMALTIVRIGLQIALREDDCELADQDRDVEEVNLAAIRAAVEADEDDFQIQRFWDAIKQLTEQYPKFVKAVPAESPVKLEFTPASVVSASRQKTLEDLILHRYGTSGHRVFRALLIEGGMEDRMIAEKCLFPLSVAREQISKMYNDRVLISQEVPRSHEKERQSNWYYLWMVNPMTSFRNMLGVMYKTLTNLYIRLESIDMDNAPPERRALLEKEQFQLLASIQRIDQSVMVMRDFGPATAAFLPTRYEVIDGQIGKLKKR